MRKVFFWLGVAVLVMLGISAHEPSSSSSSKPDIPIPAYARETLINLNHRQAQEIINANGKACPMVTGGRTSAFADTGEPYVVASCSDGSRYVLSWRSKKGEFGALSCSGGVC
jgi:hypothetical protein